MGGTGTDRRRGVSQVVGVVLLIGIVLLVSAVASYAVLGLVERPDPAPNTVIELEQTDDGDGYQLLHENGDELEGDRVELRGVADEEALHGQTFGTADSVGVVPLETEVKLVWHGDHTSYLLHTFEVESVPFEVDYRCEEAETRIENNGDLDLNGAVIDCDVTEETDTGKTDINIDLDAGAAITGTVDTDGDVDLDGSTVAGDVTTDADDITITDDSEVYGDVVAQSETNIDIDGGSRVRGVVVSDGGDVDLDDVTVEGHVYADENDFTCSGDTTIGPDGASCSEYDPKSPSEY
ncbi:type IV pilin N-terminal domain-containing protein [Halopiger djelfimassiliensis]|uniref:type IV pilin N-terminal domain-containing protein n=1 Tax=Halopiger djelfimassiliensis TaxID=1293047 RepID=UPI0006777855|nr:type IV pilin N-terminal domain-containing protein [Halopiger djelfimassiliensis]